MRLATDAIALNPQTRSDPARVKQVARDLEAQFAQMLIKNMRAATPGDPFGGDTNFRDMYDQQLAKSLTSGKGLGLAPMIERQLDRSQGVREGGGAAGTALSAGRAFSLENYARPPAARVVGGALRAVPETAAEAGAMAAGQRLVDLEAALSGSGDDASARLVDLERAVTGADTDAVGRLVALEAAFGAGAADASEAEGGGTIAAIMAARAARAAQAYDGADAASADFRAGSPEAFVAEVWPHAQKAAAELGVCPKVLVAQAALETGWGRSRIDGAHGSANNLFGIKAGRGWHGRSVGAATREVIGGRNVMENARFRAYGSTAESFADYVGFLKNNPRYADAVGQSDTRRFASALQRAGYATDPRYAAKITAIAEGPTLGRALAALDAGGSRG
ncbi:flagellar assembly peptidoglycan hydrolase FlgJ [Coralloluteibacterium stylophorae]|uniref:Peptidoglycan hydrolase FlgJ n=1 Tax=Coralloluteibacterium stylophorae TaxID=1776034 RepID=A0A8J7VU60_9GAMM|nr:flagellar assembly peptidoglycan hydrolase FlgJ [Coralloluteibacterium stylophorae]MBS7457202.1 flagellar assembly peptidoglycan hydrolase FlgJ [Coralloluteibacterium stylophorae]